MKKSSTLSFPLTIVIGCIGGGIRGQVLYSLSDDFAMSLSKAIVPNLLPIHQKEAMLNIICEVANMISSKAMISLVSDNPQINVTPPALVQGKEIEIDFLKVPAICLVMDSYGGSLEINLAFQR